MIDREKMLRDAEAATPGEWVDAGYGLIESGGDGTEIGVTPGWSTQNRQHLLNCSPEAIIALANDYKAALDANKELVEALRSILGWRELRSGASEIPIERIEEIASATLAKHAPPEAE